MTHQEQRLFLEDLEPGQVFESGRFEVTAEAIKRFAGEYDPQPFHLSENDAKDSFFGGLAASGWHTAAMTMRLLVESLPLAGGIVGASMDALAWPRPVRPGDVLRLRSEIVELRPSKSNPRRGMAKVRTTTLNQNDEPVQTLVANLVLQRR